MGSQSRGRDADLRREKETKPKKKMVQDYTCKAVLFDIFLKKLAEHKLDDAALNVVTRRFMQALPQTTGAGALPQSVASNVVDAGAIAVPELSPMRACIAPLETSSDAAEASVEIEETTIAVPAHDAITDGCDAGMQANSEQEEQGHTESKEST